MAELHKGDIVPLANGYGTVSDVKVVAFIGKGEQAWVYLVEDEQGNTHALKWYRPSFLANIERFGSEKLGMSPGTPTLQFYKNLRSLIRKGKPSDSFVWPNALTTIDKRGNFGYLMDLIPHEYVPIKSLVDRVVGISLFNLCKVLKNLCKAFYLLHDMGLAYIDLNENNCYVDPRTGKVLICDNDNVTQDGTLVGCVFGTSGFQAPEVITSLKPPNRVCDYHAEAVLFFKIMCAEHPLEGANEVALPVRTHAGLNRIYGKDAMFVFDPSGKNGPVRGVHDDLMQRWNAYPKFVHDAFIAAFSQKALHSSTDGELARERLSEIQWHAIFTRLSAQLARCPHCGRLVFADPERSSTVCPHNGCRRNIPRQTHVRSPKSDPLPVLAGKTLFESDLDPSGSSSTPLLKFGVSAAMPDAIGLVNLSKNPMELHRPDGSKGILMPGKSQIITDGHGLWLRGLELYAGEVAVKLT